jgi:hypothetical protein
VHEDGSRPCSSFHSALAQAHTLPAQCATMSNIDHNTPLGHAALPAADLAAALLH